jgi:hypothetical protein
LWDYYLDGQQKQQNVEICHANGKPLKRISQKIKTIGDSIRAATTQLLAHPLPLLSLIWCRSSIIKTIRGNILYILALASNLLVFVQVEAIIFAVKGVRDEDGFRLKECTNLANTTESSMSATS